MPYNVRKRKCKQSDGDPGSWVMSYTDKKGKHHSHCHTSQAKAKGQIAAIERGKKNEESTVNENNLRELVKIILEVEDVMYVADIMENEVEFNRC
jgi:hypothetical protein